MNTNNMNSSHEKEQSPIHSLLNILIRRGWYIIICVLALLVPIVYYNSTATRVFQATTTIIYEEPHNPIGNTQQNYRYPVKESLLNQIQEIKSRSVALEVAEELPEWISQQLPNPQNPDPSFNLKAFHAAIIKSNIDAAPVAESDVIQIKVNADNDPYVAMYIANTICDVLSERNLRIHREEVSGVRAFIEEQREEYRQQLDIAETTLRQFKVANRVTSLDKEVEEQLQLSTNIELMYQQARNEREKNQEYLKSINERIQSQQVNIAPSISDLSTTLVQQLKTRLASLQDNYIKLQLQGVPETNSKMIELQENMAQIRKNLVEEATKLAEEEKVIDPVSQMASLYQKKVELELKLQMLETQEQSLKQSLADYNNSLRRLPNKEFELARLTRERDLANNIYLMLSEKREEARINEAEKIGNMRIIDRAQLPKKPISPRKELNLAIGLMLGLTIGLGLAFFLESLDISIKTPEEVEKKTNLTVIGSIPKIKHFVPQDEQGTNMRGSPSILVTHAMPSSPASEAYRTLRTNLQFSDLSEKIRTVMFTSSGPREGKSTTSANLAVTTAQMGMRTLIIDADLRRPTIHRIFDLNREPGLSDILLNYDESDFPGNGNNDHDNEDDLEIDDYSLKQTSVRANKAVQKMVSLDLSLSAAVHKTGVDHLDVVTCGVLPPNPSEILSSETMRDLLALVKEKYEFVVIDAPPIIAVTDAAVLAPQVDGALLVIESSRNDREIILKAKSLLDRVGVNLVGAVLNNVREKNLYGDYDYYYTYYSTRNEGSGYKKKRSKFQK